MELLDLHLDACSRCQDWLMLASGDAHNTSVRQRLVGESVGRYSLVEHLGTGGMGVVYLARDIDLDRNVALKMLKLDSTQPSALTIPGIFREAKLMAQIASPHVVSVYDVGQVGDQPYIAMEYVDGVTLRQWLAQPRRALEIVELFVQIGTGVAAAHRANIVHRDFKPANVLVAAPQARGEPVAKVSDFGVASVSAIPQAGATTGRMGRGTNGHHASTSAGTPAYMAPEQRAGQPATAASDQYSVCVALYEALYQRHPTRPLTFPKDSAVPSSVERLIRKGLADDPSDRCKSMDSWTSQLARAARAHRTRGKRWTMYGLVAAAAAACAFAILQPKRAAIASACLDAGRPAELVWSRDLARWRHPSLRDAPVSKHFADIMGRNVATWSKLRRQSCVELEVAPIAAAVSSTPIARIACLDEYLSEMRSVVDYFTVHQGHELVANLAHSSEIEFVDHAISAAVGMSSVEKCQHPYVATEADSPAWTSSARLLATAAREMIGKAKGYANVGDIQEIERDVAQMAVLVPLLGNANLRAEYWNAYARLMQDDSRFDDALRLFKLSARDAAVAGNDELRAENWIAVAELVYQIRPNIEEQEKYVSFASESVLRAQNPPGMVAVLRKAESILLAEQGKYALACEKRRESLAMANLVYDKDSVIRSQYLLDWGVCLREQDQLSQASSIAEEALAILKKNLGEGHLSVALALYELALIRTNEGLYAEAHPLYAEAIRLCKNHLGEDSPQCAGLYINVGRAYRREEKFAASRQVLEFALSKVVPALGENSRAATYGQLQLASTAVGEKDWKTAEALLTKARHQSVKANGAGHSSVAFIDIERGDMMRARGRCDAADAMYRRVLPILEKAEGIGPTGIAWIYYGLGKCEWARGNRQQGIAHLENSVARMSNGSRIGLRDKVAADLKAMKESL